MTDQVVPEIEKPSEGSNPHAKSEYPAEWQAQSETTQTFPVARGTTEWNVVERKVKQTLHNAQIIQLCRIQNKWLWDNYAMHRKRVDVKNNGRVNEMELFHGTRGNDPKHIYESENGFDTRFSGSGKWGQANYFAVDAKYSHKFTHIATDGLMEILLAKVITGDSCDCNPDSSLRMPPLKPSTGDVDSPIHFIQSRYDSVTGITKGSRVYMTYDNSKAYPSYLIRYSIY